MSNESNTPFQYGFSPLRAFDKPFLARRIIAAYQLALMHFGGHGTSFWGSFEEHHRPVLEAVRRDDVEGLDNLLSDPAATDFFYGYDDLVRQFTDMRLQDPGFQENNARRIYGALLQVAIGVGAIPCPNVEAGQTVPQLAVEQVLAQIDGKFGFAVDFPNPYRNEFGLVTTRGIASERAVHALYQAWRVSRVLRNCGSDRVVEIGAGLGRNAYYARQFGIRDYTVVDIPTTQIAQADYLGRVFGARAVSLLGEGDAKPIRLRSPDWLLNTSEVFDLVLNVDSLTEIDRLTAARYVAFAKRASQALLSINHEYHPLKVADLLLENGMTSVMRSPYWARPGYVEELVLTR